MTLVITVLTLSLGTSFLCSLLEAVLLSSTHAHVEIMKKKGSSAGLLLEQLKNKIDQPLAAILTLNTISHTSSASVVGAYVQTKHGDTYTAIASAILTIVILVFTEIIPKTIGAHYWKKLGSFTAYTCKILIFILYPFVIMSKSIAKVLGAKKQITTRITREEMLANVEIGETEGILQKKETLIIKNLLKLNSIYVRDIMTPRSVLVVFQKDMTLKQVMDEYKEVPFSRIPIFDADLDNIIGMIFRFEFLEHYAEDKHELKLHEMSHPIHTIHQNQSIAATLDEFIKRREHLFLVLDDYGSTMGIVTLEDAIETLLGVEIMDETDDVEDMRKLAMERWEKKKADLQKHQELLHKKDSQR
jgi:CBS domain containing-hemolysin-like protein